MLTMTMELWPFGDKDRPKKLVTINIANVGRGTSLMHHSKCNYVWTIDEPAPLFGDPIHTEGMLLNYDRQASCTDIIAAVMTSYNSKRSIMSEYEEGTAKRMRDKTLNFS